MYSTEQIMERFGFSKSRLNQLRKGYNKKAKSKNKGEVTYQIAARLIKDVHWWYEDRNIVYDESAIPLLEDVVKDRKKESENK